MAMLGRRPMLFSLFIFMLALSQCRDPNDAGNPPNVIILLTDDQGHGDFGVYGHPHLKTPHMDRLHDESIRLTNFHVAPVCTPTRSQLMTGIDAMHNGAYSPHGQHHLLNRSYKLLPEFFLENGYNTALYGKWHLGGNSIGYRPHERGFQDAVHFLRGGHWSHPNPWNIDCLDDQYYHNGKVSNFEGYATDLWFDLGKQCVRKSKEEKKPFFLYLAVNPPHIPLLVPEKYRKPYLNLGLDAKAVNFYAMVGTVDENLGNFMDFLKKENVWENTIFLFFTDNGTALRDQEYNAGMRGRKSSEYEGGHRVPLFLHWPDGALGQPRDIPELTQVQDIAPTLIDLCRLQIDRQPAFDGIAISSLLRGASQPELADRKLIAQFREEKYRSAVMWQNWRLINGKELYDIEADLAQQNDLATKHPEIVADLRRHYESWWEEAALDPAPYFIGGNDEEVMLTAYDWYDGPRVFNWPHLRAGDKSNGKYRVVFEKAGTYSLALRRWPREAQVPIAAGVPAFMPFDSFLGPLPEGVALDIRQARIRIGAQTQEKEIGKDDLEVRFTFEVKKGETSLQTWFIDEQEEEFGAYYIYINRES